MDFHSLTRKELQALCKKNKIPANITNVAMADALKALEKVEGLDEIIYPPKADRRQSPDKATNVEPRTANRTSTRRKPINVEPESSQLMTRTRRTTKTTGGGEAEQENKNANIPETPAMQTTRRRATVASSCRKIDTQLMESGEDDPAGDGKSDVLQTPAIRSSCAKAPGVSTRRQSEAKSIQRVYGTRHSVRLLEKSLAGLSLKDEKTIEALKIEGLCEDTEPEQVEQNKDVIGDDSEMDMPVENESEMKDVLEEENKTTNDHKVTDDAKLGTCSETCTVLDRNTGLDAEAKDDDSSSVSIYEKDIVITENIETDTATPEPKTKKDLVGNQDSMIEVLDDSSAFVAETESSSNVNAAAEISVEVADLSIPEVSELEGEVSVDVMDLTEVMSEGSQFMETKQHGGDDMHPNAANEVKSDGNDTEEDHDRQEIYDEDIIKNEKSEVRSKVHQDDKCKETSDYLDLTGAMGESSQLMDTAQQTSNDLQPDAANEVDSDGNDIEEDQEIYLADIIENENSEIRSEVLQDKKCMETSNCLGKEHMTCDSAVNEAKQSDMINQDCCLSSIPDSTPVSANRNSPFHPPAAESGALAEGSALSAHVSWNSPLCPLAAESKGPTEESTYEGLVSEDKVSTSNVSSSFAPNTIQGQFPRPTALTPRNSSTKKPSTVQKITFAGINKENIDSSGMKLEVKKNEVKTKHEDMSLRQLRKKLKEMQIATNNHEKKNVSKMENRQALQVLAENCMAAAEPEQIN